jgi:sugar lactone lactonase YvrE
MTTAITSRRGIWFLSSVLLTIAGGDVCRAGVDLFESRQLTQPGEYTFGIEGPAVDKDGDLFVVNLARPGTIGILRRGATRSELFAELPAGSVGNAIRFGPDGTMYVADYKKHAILSIDRATRQSGVYFHSDSFDQPNDITIAADGTIYASDPNWKTRVGRVWRIFKRSDGTVAGEVMTADRGMGTTNGIDLSPDGKTMYVGESGTGQIWSYRIEGNELKSPRLFRTFEPDTIDGIRTDVDGRLLVARIRKGAISILSPQGATIRDVALKGTEPTNLAFGGKNGTTVFVTQRQGGYIESFETDRRGREFCLTPGSCP